MIPDIQYLTSSGKRMECQSKAQNEQPLKHILSIRIFDIFLEREEFHFLYFSSCIYVRHTLKESFFLATKGLLFLIKRYSKCSKYYCWNCDEFYHQNFKAFPSVDNFEKFIFCLVRCSLIPFPVKITHVMIGLGAYSYTKTPSCPLPRFAQTYLISSQIRPCLVLCFRK